MWDITPGQFFARMQGYYIDLAYHAEPIRSLYNLNWHLNQKKKINVKHVWPLIIDKLNYKKLTHDDLVKRHEQLTGKKVS